MIIHADCVEAMQAMEPDSVDAIVCDPPYGLEFMGKEWDRLGDIGQTSHAGPSERDGSTVFGRQRVNFNGSANVRCRTCNKWKWGHKPGDGGGGGMACTCATPDFPSPRPDQARIMQEWHQAWATEALRVLKPGGHLLAFGGTRTYHRLACAVEDAGFEIRDSLIWIYGSGFPKSLDVSKAIDKRGGVDISWFGPWLQEERERRGISRRELATHFPSRQQYAGKPASGETTGCVGNWETGVSLPTNEQFNKLCEILDLPFDRIEEAERQVLRERTMVQGGGNAYQLREGERREVDADVTAPATPEAQHWQGWGTALKPSHEPIVVARKPLVGTVAANVLEHGTGALNIDASRLGGPWESDESLCDSCAEAAATKPRPTAPATEVSTAQRLAEPTMSGRGETLPGDMSRRDIGCSNGPSPAELGDSPTVATSSSTGASGSKPTDQSPLAGSSTTSTRTEKTTGSRTCSLCGEATTFATTRQGALGRWPANVTLSHLPECKQTGTRKVKSAGGRIVPQRDHHGYAGLGDGVGRSGEVAESYRDEDGETVPAYTCAEGCPVAELDRQSGERPASFREADTPDTTGNATFSLGREGGVPFGYGDTGGASRFFYVAKASRAERNAGLEGFEEQKSSKVAGGALRSMVGHPSGDNGNTSSEDRRAANHHPTVKPIALMRWLVRLVTPPGGLVLDPFAGSGSTGVAAVLEGFDFVGVEREAEYVALAEARVKFWAQFPGADVDKVLLSDARAREIEASGQLGLL